MVLLSYATHQLDICDVVVVVVAFGRSRTAQCKSNNSPTKEKKSSLHISILSLHKYIMYILQCVYTLYSGTPGGRFSDFVSSIENLSPNAPFFWRAAPKQTILDIQNPLSEAKQINLRCSALSLALDCRISSSSLSAGSSAPAAVGARQRKLIYLLKTCRSFRRFRVLYVCLYIVCIRCVYERTVCERHHNWGIIRIRLNARPGRRQRLENSRLNNFKWRKYARILGCSHQEIHILYIQRCIHLIYFICELWCFCWLIKITGG